MWKNNSHAWHMVLVAGIVAVAVWLGAAWSAALVFAALTCAAMMLVLTPTDIERQLAADHCAAPATPAAAHQKTGRERPQRRWAVNRRRLIGPWALVRQAEAREPCKDDIMS